MTFETSSQVLFRTELLSGRLIYGNGDLSDSAMSLGDLFSKWPCIPNLLEYGFPGEMPDERGVSDQRLRGLSTKPGLVGRIGRDNGVNWFGPPRCSSALCVLGEASLADELKIGFE